LIRVLAGLRLGDWGCPITGCWMRTRYVWLVCGVAIALVECLSVLALRGRFVAADALHSLSYTLYLVAGIGAGRLEGSGRLWRAVRAGGLAGAVTGLVGSLVTQGMTRWLGLGPLGPAVAPWLGVVVLALVAVATGGTMGLLGGIVGWGVHRAVDPAA
jgi:hypothetical protein